MRNPNLKQICAFLIIGILFLLIGSCGSDKGNNRELNYMADSPLARSFDSIFEPLFCDDEPGAIVMAMSGDSIIYNRSFGIADMESGEAITDRTLFNVSSASKLFTSVALLKLCEDGKISLDDTLNKFFPEFHGVFFKEITIKHILTHSSGLPDLRPRNTSDWNKYLLSHSSVFLYGKDYSLYGDEDEHMKIFQNLEYTEFKPGTKYQRNDPAYIIVAPLIERVTGVNFDTWMEENIFKPAGMREVFYYAPGFDMPKTAHAYCHADSRKQPVAYRSADGRWDEYDFGEAPFFLTKADRGVYTSGRDFMRWKKSLYDYKIISDSSLKVMGTPYIATNIPMVSFGLGMGVYQAPGKPSKNYQTNENGGFSAVTETWPSKKLHYLVFSNRADWNRRAVMHSIDSIFEANGYLEP